jgi:SAM-dependent methyltransferase
VGTVTGDSSLQTEVLEDLSDARRYRRWLADLARPHLGPDPVEIGSGTGEYALEWVSSVTSFTATEAETGRLGSLRRRFEGHPVIRVRHLLLGGSPGESEIRGTRIEDGPAPRRTDAPEPQTPAHSAAVAFNVLEHIPDHVAALQSMKALVRPGGAIVLVVPAFPSAMSRFDLAIGHQRRYTRGSLGEALAQADLETEQLRYINPIGLLNWYVAVKGLRMRPRNGPALRLFDAAVVPVARLLDRVSVPFGQSVFAVARVP